MNKVYFLIEIIEQQNQVIMALLDRMEILLDTIKRNDNV